MKSVIEKIRQLNSIFNKSSVSITPLNSLCSQLCEIIVCNIYIFDTSGNIFAYSVANKYLCRYTERSLENHELPGYYLDLFFQTQTCIQGMHEEHPACTYHNVKECIFKDRYYSLYPIYSNFHKSAGILLIRYGENFSESDNILCEYTRAIISLEMMHQEQRRLWQESFKIVAARQAVRFLTFSERKAVETMLEQLTENEGDIFLNVIAAKSYIAQSIVTSALKKLEGAEVITTSSHGVKGKFIKITNAYLREEIIAANKNMPFLND